MRIAAAMCIGVGGWSLRTDPTPDSSPPRASRVGGGERESPGVSPAIAIRKWALAYLPLRRSRTTTSMRAIS